MTWVEFTEIPNQPGRKTRVWRVNGKGRGAPGLGVVRWFGRWRQYTFMPDAGTTFNPDCLATIGAFCTEQTRAHRHAVPPVPEKRTVTDDDFPLGFRIGG